MTKYIDMNNRYYPEKLKSIKNPPEKIYYKGNLKLLHEESIAVIGTRNITEYGRKICKSFVRNLALRDIVIISGMAIGTDRIAHEETLNVFGKTIAVLGSGFKNIYPMENIDIFNRILENDGLILSEYSDNEKPKPSNFPKRNRIVSGLAEGILVIEAGYRSGTSITVRLANEQKKKVYAIPGRLDSKYGVGVNKFIQEGAKLTTCEDDIIKDFPSFKARQKRKIANNERIKKEYRKIYDVISCDPISLEEIAMKTKNDVRCTAKLITLMEIEDLIEQISGLGYVKKE